MSQSSSEDPRLRATEEQMRRALGLHEAPYPRSEPAQATPTSDRSQRPSRRFVRDGEVPVTVLQRSHRQDDGSVINQLEAARQAVREQAEARERAERSLAEAQAAIRDLQTKLGHDRLAKDEALQAVRRADAERQAVQQALDAMQGDLAAERALREKAEQGREQAVAARQDAVQRLREVTLVQQLRVADTAAGPAEAGKTVKPVRPRGRPPKPRPVESEPVEWWVKGWQKKFR